MTGESPTCEAERTTRDAAASSDGDPVPAAVRTQIRERAATIRDEQVEEALARLEARGDLSQSERAAVERLADRLVTRLVAVPDRALREEADRETVEAALELFG